MNGAAFTYVGHVVGRRQLGGEEGRANNAFVTWWYTLGGLSFVGAGFSLAAALGYTDLALHVTLLHIALLVLFIGLWGLGYYLAFLFTGNRSWFRILGALYSIYYVLLVYLVVRATPNRVIINRYNVELGYEREITEALPFVSILLVLLILPQIIGALAYFSLLFRVRAPMQRYRIGMVAGTFLAWFGTSIIAGTLELSDTTEWWQPVSQAISVAAALLILLAYRPPKAWVRALEALEAKASGGPV